MYSNNLGLAQYDKEIVIKSCNNALKSIYKSRRLLRKEVIQEILDKEIWWWEHLWKWIGYKRPTKKMAMRIFLKSPIPLSCSIAITYGKSESICKEILRMCKACKEDKIWLSSKAVTRCRLYRYS
jgi:hypothetical protein